MNLLALTKYGDRAAATRQRFKQYEGFLERAGINISYAPLFDNTYLDTLFDRNRKQAGAALSGYRRRLAQLQRLDAFDGAWIHCDLLPYFPGWIEPWLLSRARRVIFDYDDAIFHQYDQHRNPLVRSLLGGKLKPLLRRADLAICGNAYLRDYAGRYCQRTEIVPTVVDTDAYGAAPKADGAVTLGWIGAPSTWAFVKPLVPLLVEAAARHDLAVRIVGAGPQTDIPPGFSFLPWSEPQEIALIQGMDFGIMPLPDEPWARGKCGYKLIQYMACGLPVIASPVGVNTDIVDHGENGLLATTPEEWQRAIATLAGDAALRRAMGAAGRRKVEQAYSLAVQGPRLAGMLRHVMEAGRARRGVRGER